ncbi:MAG: peptidoglycan-associated lipoprotein Pal [Geobacteraceae bacterium]|nr:peptidoglycan-associated lipoprotein Pal [Geobacteraceae bacterium]
MKKNRVGLVLFVSCFMFVVGGCASNEIVKKDEPITPATKTTAQAKVEPGKMIKPSEQPGKPAPIKQSTVDSSVPSQNADKFNVALARIYFDFDSYNLSPEARSALQKNMEIIENSSATVVRIEGNCDERGSAEYNLALGEKRAKAAMQYLVTLGIPEKRLSVISYGKERPAVQGNDESAWSKNRRDEFVIQK